MNRATGPMGYHQAYQHTQHGVPEEEKERGGGRKKYLKKEWPKTSKI